MSQGVAAEAFLIRAGYTLRADYGWDWPDPPRIPTDEELAAVRYLQDVHGYGWVGPAREGVRDRYRRQQVGG